MTKRLCIMFLSFLLVVPAMAQHGKRGDNASFSAKKGDWQVDMVLGSSRMFNENTGSYLLHDYKTDNNIGLGGSWTDPNQSGAPTMYLNLNSITGNSIANIVGLQGSYFITDRIAVTAAFSMNINATASRDYIEGENLDPNAPDPLDIPGVCYVEGQLTNNWYTSVGGNYYFKTKNERINLYAGALLGYQMGRIQTQTPYTGNTVDDGLGEQVDESVYYPSNNGGQIQSFNGSLVAGIAYSVAKGVVVGFEVRPVSYNYSMMQVKPYGYDSFRCSTNNVQLLALPNVKVGFRF